MDSSFENGPRADPLSDDLFSFDALEPLLRNGISLTHGSREDRNASVQGRLLNSNISTSGSGNQDLFSPDTLEFRDFAFESLSSSIEERDSPQEMEMSSPIVGDLVLVRRFQASSVAFSPADRTEDIHTIVTEHHIPEVHRNNALQYVNANWSSMQYISECEIISFGGYDENMRVAIDKVVWFDLRNMKIAREWPVMKVSGFAPVVILVSEFVYVFGGGFGLPIDCTRVEAERLNIRTKLWEDLPKLTYPKRTANPSHYHGIIYLVGGLGSPHNEAYRISQGDYIPLNITYPLPELDAGIRSISYIIGNELVLLNSHFQQVFQLEHEFTYKSWELMNYKGFNMRSAVSPIDRGNLVYSTALFIDEATGIRRNSFCIYNKCTRSYHVKAAVNSIE